MLLSVAPRPRELQPSPPTPSPQTIPAGMVDTGDPHSVSQLLRLLENLLDKHIEDRRYASSVTIRCSGRGGN